MFKFSFSGNIVFLSVFIVFVFVSFNKFKFCFDGNVMLYSKLYYLGYYVIDIRIRDEKEVGYSWKVFGF